MLHTFEIENVDVIGRLGVLILSKMSGGCTGFLVLVNDIDEIKTKDANKLIPESTVNGNYVSAMQLRVRHDVAFRSAGASIRRTDCQGHNQATAGTQ